MKVLYFYRKSKNIRNEENVKEVSTVMQNKIENISFKPKVFDIKKLKIKSAFKKPFSEGVLLELFENLNLKKTKKDDKTLVIEAKKRLKNLGKIKSLWKI